MSFESDDDEVWDSDDKPESEEKDDVILDKFKVLDTDPDDKNNTPETKASKDRSDENGLERNKEKAEMLAKAEEDKRRQDEEAEQERIR